MSDSLLSKIKNLIDLNKNGEVEWWEVAVFILGFIAAGMFLDSML